MRMKKQRWSEVLRKGRLRGAAALGVVSLIAACATSPTGRKQFIAVPGAQMNQMGATAFSEMKQKQKVSNDPELNRYVNCVAKAVASVAKDETGVKEWEVAVFEDESANAFALPGGHIGVHTGILPIANTPGQLAAVLGHEVGHVIARHGAERVSQSLAAAGGLAALDAFINGDGKSTGGQLIMAGLGLGLQFGVLMPFSRTHESESDVIGLRLAAQAGFDPREAVTLWQNMAKAGNGQPPEFMSTHPSHETRIENLKAHMKEAVQIYEQKKESGETPNCQVPSQYRK